MSRLLGWPALLCAAAFVLMPRIVTGSAYADMRLLPFTVALAVLAIDVRMDHRRTLAFMTLIGLLFLTVRIGANTASFLLYDAAHRRELKALDSLPRGASVLSLVARPCRWVWTTPRADHLPSLAIVRRDAFTNDQWTTDGAQLIKVRQPFVGDYGADPSQMIYPPRCRDGDGSDFDEAIAKFDRRAFDHVWTIGFPPGRARATDLRLIWTDGRSALYRVAPKAETE